MRKLIVTVATTGGLHGKEANPALPEQPVEIAKEAYDCYNEGAAIIHVHARDNTGKITSDPAVYREIHRMIREKCPLIIQDTTGGGPGLTLEDRMRILDAQPEMASLNMGTMLRVTGPNAGSIFMNPTWEIERFARVMQERGIKAEMEVFSHAMYREVQNLIIKGLVDKPYYINLVLGMKYQGAIDATPKHLLSLIDFLPSDCIFNVSAIGGSQLPLTTLSMLMGGMVRVGMEDNIYYRKGELAHSNAQLVARTVRIARELGLEIASPEEARAMLGIPPLGV